MPPNVWSPDLQSRRFKRTIDVPNPTSLLAQVFDWQLHRWIDILPREASRAFYLVGILFRSTVTVWTAFGKTTLADNAYLVGIYAAVASLAHLPLSLGSVVKNLSGFDTPD